jgi:tRNA1(Val) A37 N6-methylase TrmN6
MLAPEDLTCDDFIGGRVRLWQPKLGYRAGVDPVLMAASVPAKTGQSVLELGCGTGAAILCLANRVKGLNLTGVELNPAYADLARRNASENGINMQVVTADLVDLPKDLSAKSFDHVIANPPYYREGSATGPLDSGRHKALSEVTALSDWIDVALRRLLPGGWLTIIQRADRLADILTPLQGRSGGTLVLPIVPRQGRAASLVIVQTRKGGRADLKLLSPLIMHQNPQHVADGDDYTEIAYKIQREGAALPLTS